MNSARYVVVHEIGHQFGPPSGLDERRGDADNVMWVARSDPKEEERATVPLVFHPEDIRAIRNTERL